AGERGRSETRSGFAGSGRRASGARLDLGGLDDGATVVDAAAVSRACVASPPSGLATTGVLGCVSANPFSGMRLTAWHDGQTPLRPPCRSGTLSLSPQLEQTNLIIDGARWKHHVG